MKMIQRFSHENIVWLDVIHPTNKDLRTILKACPLPTELVGDLTSMTPRTETKHAKNVLKITLDFPVVKRTDIKHPHEIKFIATKSHLITIRFEDINAVHSFSKQLEVVNILKHASKKATGAHLLLALLQYLYNALDEKIDYLESRIQETEENIFQDNEKEMLFAISNISRRAVSFKHVLESHESALTDLDTAATSAFGRGYTHQIEAVVSTYEHLVRRADRVRSVLEDLRDTNNALLSTKQNEVMKILTIMAFITFPLT
ncbi:MAG: CorA family divalent cation transporter, partial [Candidatus Paceibacterota bacterium]